MFFFSLNETPVRNMEKYWQSKEILRRLIFLPSAPDATDGCGRNVKFCTKRFDITVVEEKCHILQKLIPRARERKALQKN